MKIMFIGLGLIGGSMAMALEGYPDLECYAVDGDEPTRLEALGRNDQVYGCLLYTSDAADD